MISTRGRYALRMMADLAAHEKEGFISLKDIAERQAISKKYLEQIIPALLKADYLRAGRGAQGGYRLTRPAEQYTVGEILRLTEGPLVPVDCVEQDSFCVRSADCAALPIWKGLTVLINNYLNGISLQDMLDQQREHDADNYMI